MYKRQIQQRADYLLQQEYAKVAVTRGWSKWTILKRYVFRNTFPLLIPQLTRVFTLVLTQCMLVENVLGWPGIGRWLIDAVTQQDYNSISAGVVAVSYTHLYSVSIPSNSTWRPPSCTNWRIRLIKF